MNKIVGAVPMVRVEIYIIKVIRTYHDPRHANQPLQCQLWYPFFVFILFVSFAFSDTPFFFNIYFFYVFF